MAIFRCNKCSYIREVASSYVGKTVKCPKCEHSSTIYDTVAFLNALIKKHIAQTKELHHLRKDLTSENSAQETFDNIIFEDIDIHNTNIFTQKQNLVPLEEWFEKQNFKVSFNPDTVDTTGFFDEIALLLGKNFDVLSSVSNQIKHNQNKGYSSVKVDLSKKDQNDIQQITSFCKALYDYSFVAKYHYQKKDKIIRLTLQTAPNIRQFFNGIWMEWFALMEVLKFFSDSKINFSCSRGINISFSNNNSYELDLFFLTDKNIPICIECKTGEFRHDIDKYLNLRKQLNIDKNQFVICIFGLSQEQAHGMNSMYNLTFVNENSLLKHIQAVI